MTSVNYGDGQTQTYAFDPMDGGAAVWPRSGQRRGPGPGRSQKADSVTGTENSTYNAANMILTRGASNNYTYDNNGNTLTGGGRTNTWDSENRMVKSVAGANTSYYTYAADGLRHRSVVNSNTTDYSYDADMFVREISGGTNLATYLAGPIGPMYRRDDVGGILRWYCYDALGSVLAEVDNTGTITASRAFDVYGSVRNSTGTSTSKHKFVGQLGHTSDDETGLIYMRARYMDPATGMFVSEDPGRQGANWFAYCNANPVAFVDRSGTNPLLILALIALVVGLIAALIAYCGGQDLKHIFIAFITGFLATLAMALLGEALAAAGASAWVIVLARLGLGFVLGALKEFVNEYADGGAYSLGKILSGGGWGALGGGLMGGIGLFSGADGDIIDVLFNLDAGLVLRATQAGGSALGQLTTN